MDRAVFQHMIDSGTTAQAMTAIARGYLSGAVIRDKTAAEAWLMKAIEAEDPVFSTQAMGVLAREILGREDIIAEEEIPELRSRAVSATGREKEELEALLELI